MGACCSRADKHGVTDEFYNIRVQLNTISRHQANAIAELKRTMVTIDADRARAQLKLGSAQRTTRSSVTEPDTETTTLRADLKKINDRCRADLQNTQQ